MEWFAHIDGCCWRSGIIWRQTCPQLAALQLVHEFNVQHGRSRKSLWRSHSHAIVRSCCLPSWSCWLAHYISYSVNNSFCFYLSVTCTAGKQAWNAVPSHLPFYSVAGMMELCFHLCFTSHSVVGILVEPCSWLLRKFLWHYWYCPIPNLSGMHMHFQVPMAYDKSL